MQGWMLSTLLLAGPLAAQAPATAAGSTPAATGSTAATPGPVVDMATLQVSGERPGPGMWKVSNAQGHVLWLLGTVSPVPAGVQWRSTEVNAVIAQADHVLGAPGWGMGFDVGFFKGLTLLPLARRTVRDPQGRTLQEQLPPALYNRWLQLKPTYLGRDRGVEKERAMVASGRLHAAFLKRNGLGGPKQLRQALQDQFKANKLTAEDTRLILKIDDARATLKEMQATALDDRACFERTLDVVEYQAPVLRERANAWALGDVAALRRLANTAMLKTCMESAEDTDFAQRRGWTNLDARARAQWLQRVDAALAAHGTTFGTIAVNLLLGSDDYLGALQARGYTIESPPE